MHLIGGTESGHKSFGRGHLTLINPIYLLYALSRPSVAFLPLHYNDILFTMGQCTAVWLNWRKLMMITEFKQFTYQIIEYILPQFLCWSLYIVGFVTPFSIVFPLFLWSYCSEIVFFSNNGNFLSVIFKEGEQSEKILKYARHYQ